MYTVLMHGIRIIFTDQIPSLLFSEKYILCWQQNFQQSNSSLTCHKNEKAQYKVALTQYLKTHSFYSANEFYMPEGNTSYHI
jgi:hypothetical protein